MHALFSKEAEMIENSSIGSQLSARAHQSYQAGNNIATYRQNGNERAAIPADRVSLSSGAESPLTYDSSMSLRGGQNDGYDLLRGLVLNLFKEQGIEVNIATDAGGIDLTTLSPEEAQDLIAEDGYFGVEQTSQRIFELAVGIAGGDPTRLAAIKAGVEKGFQEAYETLGGWLPDISYDTYDAVMKKLDDWAGQSDSLTS